MTSSPSVEELLERGVAYHEVGSIEAARLHYVGALLSAPDHPAALMNLSAALLSGRMDAAALSAANRGLRAAPDASGLKINKAGALYALGRFDEALKLNQEILLDDPTIAGVWHNMGIVLSYKQQFNEALNAYDKALALPMRQNLRQMAESDRALALLSLGELVEGLRAYRVRWSAQYKVDPREHGKIDWGRLYRCGVWNLGLPIWWEVPDLQGKRLLVHHEQGFGDGIMLCRFLPELRSLGIDSLTVAAPEELRELFEQFGFPVEDWNDEEGLRARNCDVHMPMLDMLSALELTPDMISPRPYLTAGHHRHKLGPDGYRIGICWASGDHSFALEHRRRYVPLESFFPLSEIPGVRLVGLQKGHPEKDILNLGAESFIFDPMPRCGNFRDTAEVIQDLDLVISVDSAIAHLAGALGKPCYMLGPFARCWRWWEDANGFPWYEKFAILKQSHDKSWDAAMDRVTEIVQLLLHDGGQPDYPLIAAE